MRIKSYKLFLESARHEISKGEEDFVKQLFRDLLEDYNDDIIGNKPEIYEDIELENDFINYLPTQKPNTFKFLKRYYYLDCNGQDSYSSKILKEKCLLGFRRKKKSGKENL